MGVLTPPTPPEYATDWQPAVYKYYVNIVHRKPLVLVLQFIDVYSGIWFVFE